MATQFVVIHHTTDALEAQMLAELLNQEGFDAHLIRETHGPLLGVAEFILKSRLEVPSEQAEEATARVASILEARQSTAMEDEEGPPEPARSGEGDEEEAEPPPAPGTTADPSRDPTWSPLLGLTLLHAAIFYVSGGEIDRLIELGALSGWPPVSELYRLVTHGFLHLDMAHLLVNTISLLVFGWASIRLFGLGRSTLVYALGIVASGVCTALVIDVVAAGASGAIFSVAALALFGRLRLAVRGPELHRRRELLRVFGMVVLVLPSAVMANYVAHLAGVSVGAAFGWWIRPAPREEDAAFRRCNWIAGIAGAAFLFIPWAWRLASGFHRP